MKPYLKPSSIKLITVLLSVIVVIVIHSCRKDIVQYSQSVVANTLNTHGISLSQLQNAYANGIKGNKLKTTDISPQDISNIIGTLNVDWKSYTLQEFSDSTKIVEFPMPDDTTLIAPSDSIQTGNNKYRSKTTAVFILHKDTVTLDFFMKTVEDLNDPNYQSVINQQHYLDIAATFNGEVMYFTLDRQFINGYLWKNGIISKGLSIGTVTSQPPLQTQSYQAKTKIVNVQYTNCVEDTYEIVEITTVTTPYGSTTTVKPTGVSVSIITCDIVGDPSSSGGVSTGGGVPPPPPCNPGSSGTVTSSVKGGRLIINVTTGGSGSGTTTTTSPPCLPNPTTSVPVPPPPPVPPDPCTQASSLANNQAFVSKMNYLATLKNTPGETADAMEPNGTFNQQVSTVNGGADQNFPLSFFNGSTGFLHNHGNGPGIISVFTANDISSLYTIVTKASVSNPSTYTYGMENQHGQGYLLTISNMSNFTTWASTYTSNGAPNDICLSFYNNLISANNSDTANEDQLTNFLNLTKSGLTLMKANSTNTTWSRIVQNSDGTYSIVQCPSN